ncbi:non-hydrolyzing UDP-N-acetylglucosamine 2-epimerase [Candidatus Entotheonella palauensis]|uniref:non-hydrolyzing UDP-N-acetylglucosamine 2-epimerase n=1 Tax=Candidatus Entotheonella palauensis TaxID=93172 RepID=UPI000B7D540B|nr:UDP-N-acetylglucosamine 2-epimerase (non-hydrolyzing) [Candidatus Entotheonella palauensis]
MHVDGNAKIKILAVFGTRPEAIKLAPIIHTLKQRPDMTVAVCLTGQHRQMVKPVISFFNLNIDYDLDIMSQDQSLFDITAKALHGLQQTIASFQPDWILVQGDTTTTFTSALAGFYSGTKVAHIEAGLRIYHKYAPFPEEINRVLTTRLSDIHFAATDRARDNLLKEGIDEANIYVVGNPIIDAMLMTEEKIRSKSLDARFQNAFQYLESDKRLILVTGHRRESFGQPFEDICKALKHLAQSHEVEIVYPVHLNPNVTELVHRMLGDTCNIRLLEPVEYPMFLWLMQKSYLILTDSGGVQEEAPAWGKPVVVMRETTERTESLEAGVSVLAGTSTQAIVEAVERLLDDEQHYQAMARQIDLYGDGATRYRIADILMRRA